MGGYGFISTLPSKSDWRVFDVLGAKKAQNHLKGLKPILGLLDLEQLAYITDSIDNRGGIWGLGGGVS
jgi:hypothetical protein